MIIKLGHSPDADDAFMFYGLATGKVDSGQYVIQHVLQDIQTLNERAMRGELEITAVSAHAYAYVRDKYALTRCGGSFGENYGPKIVQLSDDARKPGELRSIAVPGLKTSAYLALRLFLADVNAESRIPNPDIRVVPFDQIIPAVQRGEVDCGLIIHEGQVTYDREGLRQIVDLGQWWAKQTGGLPLPLGCNAIRKDLPGQVQTDLSRILLESIRYSLDHRAEALAHAMQYSRSTPTDLADKFVGMYVNDLTIDMGARGRAAIEEFLGRGHRAGLIPNALPLEIL